MARDAHATDPDVYARAAADPEAFWAAFAAELEWMQPWTKVLDWQPPHAKWFVGGRLNISANCLDRHVRTARRNKAALIWEGEPGDRRTLTYFDLHRQVSQFANVLKSLGVKKGDRVALYMPLIPELAIAMLACARIGAVHSVVFGGFSAEALRDRINDAQASVLVTADGGYRRGQIVPLKQMADEALSDTPSIRHVVDRPARRAATPFPVHVQEGRDHWYHRLMQDAARHCAPEPMDSEDMLYILYTSGTTGKPKGIVHTTGGYLVGAYATTRWVFDLRDEDVYWCTADIGWVTGHSYVVYGPLANGATVLMYEGAPDWPQKDRFWELIERYGVTIFYTAPTAIRAFMKWGTEWPAKRDLSSLRLLGSVGEPINPEAWMWYHEHIGRKRCPDRRHVVADGDGPHPDHAAARHHAAQARLGDEAVSRHLRGDAQRARASASREGGGLLALTKPWPGMLRGIYGDPERFVQQYWSKWKRRRLLHRRRRARGQGRLLLAARPRRRRAERRGPSHRHDGGGERARRSSEGGGGGGRRQGARDQGPGGRGVRHAEGRRDAPSAGAHRRAEGARRQEDRRARAARSDPVRRRPAEDAVGQDHAPAAARHRRRQGARRHDDAGRPECGGAS